MLQSPFAFYRGGAAIMAQDLANQPATNINVQLCGDMHVSNFGLFGTAEHRLVFGINDFDENLLKDVFGQCLIFHKQVNGGVDF
jgi:uncharacterized protein (DUF2252 family)